MSSQVIIDGKETQLFYDSFHQEHGHLYLTHDRGPLVRHYFKVRLTELPIGFAFKTKGRLYEILGHNTI